ncbi:dihydroxyacetone kinase phosphoryl donor subunit DhaM [[Acholeplasma] multilocale]|uniref:dihydroxyacetone kinase phosphoryl donor subunit DhaM n=1 Tax=[Acholeplasma] multilocale TaxID=264638 RepID=UPI0003F96BAA|nr:dihydroxyacetone kinase phosphoryl donor subunit DhaM [[Acholeplasma] multilocale]
MIGIVVVSHSHKLAKAAIEFVSEMQFEDFNLMSCAGINDGIDFGTDPMLIKSTIEKADSGSGVLVICDLGSSIMNTEMAINFLDLELQAKTLIADAPFLEGLLVAVTSNSFEINLDDLKTKVEKESRTKKIE